VSETIKLALALALVCVFSGIIISFTHSSTAQKIEAQKLREQRSALSQVFAPGARSRRYRRNAPSSTAILDRQERTINHGVRICGRKQGIFRDYKVYCGN